LLSGNLKLPVHDNVQSQEGPNQHPREPQPVAPEFGFRVSGFGFRVLGVYPMNSNACGTKMGMEQG
jgi:hypothetical protein